MINLFIYQAHKREFPCQTENSSEENKPTFVWNIVDIHQYMKKEQRMYYRPIRTKEPSPEKLCKENNSFNVQSARGIVFN